MRHHEDARRWRGARRHHRKDSTVRVDDILSPRVRKRVGELSSAKTALCGFTCRNVGSKMPSEQDRAVERFPRWVIGQKLVVVVVRPEVEKRIGLPGRVSNGDSER